MKLQTRYHFSANEAEGHSLNQIVAILQEHAAGAATGELIRRHGISRETFYKWRRKYGGLKIDEAKRLRAQGGESQPDAGGS